MAKFAAWESAKGCVGSAQPGAKAVMAWILEAFPKGQNWGIYNCRNVRGGAGYSAHAEGRACDVGMPMTNGRGSAAGRSLVKRLCEAGETIGLQVVIYDRKIYSAKSPTGRKYTGTNPHYDHVHLEITTSAAKSMTLATVRQVMGDAPSRYQVYKKGAAAGSRRVRLWSAGDDVKELQQKLNSAHPDLAKLATDGYFGVKTEERVKYHQRRAKITIDGIVGPQTWGTLGVG